MSTHDPEFIRSKLASGITQIDFGKLLNANSNSTSKTVKRLLEHGNIKRTRRLQNGRWTYLLSLSNDSIQAQEIGQCIIRKGKPQPKLDFVAPNLTPRIRYLVDLRLAGHTIKEISKLTNLSKVTVDNYLRYAREPERYFHDKQKRHYPNLSPLIDRVQKLLAKDGIIISHERNLPHFREIAEHLNKTQEAYFTSFPAQRKYFGRLANSTIIYIDKQKAARHIAKVIQKDVFENFEAFRMHSGGTTRPVSGFTHALNNTFPADREIADIIRGLLEDVRNATLIRNLAVQANNSGGSSEQNQNLDIPMAGTTNEITQTTPEDTSNDNLLNITGIDCPNCGKHFITENGFLPKHGCDKD